MICFFVTFPGGDRPALRFATLAEANAAAYEFQRRRVKCQVELRQVDA